MMAAFVILGLLIMIVSLIITIRSFSELSIRRSHCPGAATSAAENKTENKGIYLDLADPDALNKFINCIREFLFQKDPGGRQEKVILCIGSDRCTGDCLGPLVGSSLQNNNSGKFIVYGTLQSPVHALNLTQYIKQIGERHSQPLIIAIDASLSYNKQDVGKVWINNGALNPGNAVDKQLPAVGDISITGIVNDFQKIHSTRLYNVTGISQFITRGVQAALDYRFVIPYTEAGTEANKEAMSCH